MSVSNANGEKNSEKNMPIPLESVDPEYLKGAEVRIPMPWGFIAGKSWGNTSGSPVIGIHGECFLLSLKK